MERTDTRHAGEDRDVVGLRNANVCHEGVLLQGQSLRFSGSTGLIVSSSVDGTRASEVSNGPVSDEVGEAMLVDLEVDDIVAPGLIELQTNGLCGIHFTALTEDNHEGALEKVSQEMAKNGVTAWYATVPTVEGNRWKEVSTEFRHEFP